MPDKRQDELRDHESEPQPDRETLHTVDPQENMEGPVSSTIRNSGEAFETDESKEEADRKKDRNT